MWFLNFQVIYLLDKLFQYVISPQVLRLMLDTISLDKSQPSFFKDRLLTPLRRFHASNSPIFNIPTL